VGYERRAFLALIAGGGCAYAWWTRGAGKSASLLPDHVPIADFDDRGLPLGVREAATVRKTDAEWQRVLPADSFSVTRRADTEFAGRGRYDKFYEDGIYRCICCDTALFDSKTKYASGTGWPSFTQPIAKENVVERTAVALIGQEIEVSCARCAAHLGHVFDDGPPPGGLRYCINSVALTFRAA